MGRSPTRSYPIETQLPRPGCSVPDLTTTKVVTSSVVALKSVSGRGGGHSGKTPLITQVLPTIS